MPRDAWICLPASFNDGYRDDAILSGKLAMHSRERMRFDRSAASEVGRVEVSVLLWRDRRVAGKLVPAWRYRLALYGTNDDAIMVVRAGVMHRCGIGRRPKAHCKGANRKAQDNRRTHRSSSNRTVRYCRDVAHSPRRAQLP